MRSAIPFLTTLWLSAMVAHAAHEPSGSEKAIMASATGRIDAYHRGEAASRGVLRLVYFHPADREPLPDYELRLERILSDVSAFYGEGMEAFGVKNGRLPLERTAEGRLVIHKVRGKKPLAAYTHESGDATWAEVKAATRGTWDADREHVLILYALCDKAEDGRYIFTAPYYGAAWSDHRRGLCHAADCELLDPPLLEKSNRQIVFTEHYYERMVLPLATFNAWYLGGIAHELGHGLGFPHDNGGPKEDRQGISLMGGGNLHYREDRSGGRQPSYLSLATALRWAAHPLRTQSNKGRFARATARIDGLLAADGEKGLRLTGKIVSPIPACAAIATLWPTTARTDHGAVTFCGAIEDSGAFALDLGSLKDGRWNLVLGSLLANGAEDRTRTTLDCVAGKVDVLSLNTEFSVAPVERALMEKGAEALPLVSDAALAAAPTDEARRQLRLLRTTQEPAVAPVDLTTTDDRRVFVSDARWTTAEVGWGKVCRNRYWFNPGQWEGLLLKLGNRAFAKGLYAHGKSRFVFPLGKRWKVFTGTVGLRDGAHPTGSAVFTVWGDGRELARSKVMHVGETAELIASTADVQELELRVEGGEGHTRNCWAIWADPMLTR